MMMTFPPSWKSLFPQAKAVIQTGTTGRARDQFIGIPTTRWKWIWGWSPWNLIKCPGLMMTPSLERNSDNTNLCNSAVILILGRPFKLDLVCYRVIEAGAADR